MFPSTVHITSSLGIPKEAGISLIHRLYGGWSAALLHSTLFNALFLGGFALLWRQMNAPFARDLGLHLAAAHPRDERNNQEFPVHYELFGKCIIGISCAYAATQLACYPIGVYRNMR